MAAYSNDFVTRSRKAGTDGGANQPAGADNKDAHRQPYLFSEALDIANAASLRRPANWEPLHLLGGFIRIC